MKNSKTTMIWLVIATMIGCDGYADNNNYRVDSEAEPRDAEPAKTILEYTKQDFLDAYLNLDIEGSLIAGHPRLFLTQDLFGDIMLNGS